MSLRSKLPLIASLNFAIAVVLYGISSAITPADAPLPPLDPDAQARLEQAKQPPVPLTPPRFTSLEPLDVASLEAGCPPLKHDPWRGQIRTLSDGSSAFSQLLLAHHEVLSLSGELYHHRRRQIATSSLSLVALPRSPYGATTTRKVLPRQFHWFAYETPESIFTFEQPAADGQDTIVRYDRSTLAETARWALPLIPGPESPGMSAPTYRLEVPTTLADGRLAVCITTGEPGTRHEIAPRMHSGLCLIEPDAPSSTTPPPYVTASNIAGIVHAWPTSGTEVHAIARIFGTHRRLLLDWDSGMWEEIAPNDPRFDGYAAAPPRVRADAEIDRYVGWRNARGGQNVAGLDTTITYGPGAIALYMPVADLSPLLANGFPGYRTSRIPNSSRPDLA